MDNFDQIEKVIEKLLFPYLQQNHPDSEILQYTSKEIIEQIQLVISARPHGSKVPTLLIWNAFFPLVFNDRNDDEWLLAFHNFQHWYENTKFPPQAPGAPSKLPLRMYVFAYVEYHRKMKEVQLEEACSKAATVFDLPLDRVELWCLERRRYNAERAAIAELFEFAHTVRNANSDEVIAFLKEKIPNLPIK